MEMSLWLEFRACLCARCAPDLSHSSILKKHCSGTANVAVARVSRIFSVSAAVDAVSKVEKSLKSRNAWRLELQCISQNEL